MMRRNYIGATSMLAMVAHSQTGGGSGLSLAALDKRIDALEAIPQPEFPTGIADDLAGLTATVAELRKELEAARERLERSENDLRAIHDAPKDDIATTAEVASGNTDFDAFAISTPNFPKGFLHYVLTTNFRSELLNYTKEVAALPSTVQATDLA